MGRITKSIAGGMPVLVPGGKASRRDRPLRPRAPNWGWLAWVAIAVGAGGLLLWRVLTLMP
jgi:hypothetical protein